MLLLKTADVPRTRERVSAAERPAGPAPIMRASKRKLEVRATFGRVGGGMVTGRGTSLLG